MGRHPGGNTAVGGHRPTVPVRSECSTWLATSTSGPRPHTRRSKARPTASRPPRTGPRPAHHTRRRVPPRRGPGSLRTAAGGLRGRPGHGGHRVQARGLCRLSTGTAVCGVAVPASCRRFSRTWCTATSRTRSFSPSARSRHHPSAATTPRGTGRGSEAHRRRDTRRGLRGRWSCCVLVCVLAMTSGPACWKRHRRGGDPHPEGTRSPQRRRLEGPGRPPRQRFRSTIVLVG